MYDKFFLSGGQTKLIDEWFNLNKVLIIHGKSGVGKSLLAKEIFKDRIITEIDTLNIKNNNNLEDYLINIISKKNISLMFDNNKKERGIIIDNINIFHKYDKRNFKLLCNFLVRKNFYKTKIICISDTKFLINKSIKKINSLFIHLKYDSYHYHKIINNIVSDYNLNLSFDKKNSLLLNSNYDLNRFITQLNDIDNKNILDNFDSSSILYEKIFKEKINIKDISRLFDSDKITISLNLLENITDYTININDILDIYNYYVFADIHEKHTLNNNLNFYSIYTIGIYNLKFSNKNIKSYNFDNNKYLSQSFIYIHNDKIISNIHKYHDNIYFYLYLYNSNKNNDVKKYITNLNTQELNFYIKSFYEFYKIKFIS
jgi:hypothetical protein